MTGNGFEAVEQVADAVMYEGYVLYPYRASAMKNRFRWQFGVVAPRAYAERDGADPWYAQTECLVAGGDRPRLWIKVRCLQLQRRTVEEPLAAPGAWRACDRVAIGGRELLTWDEAVPRAMVSPPLQLDPGGAREQVLPFELGPACEREIVCDADGRPAARLTRERWPISAVIRIHAIPAGDLMKVRVRVENLTPWTPPEADGRDVALRQSLLGCHTLLRVESGQFLSAIDPPPHAAALARACANEHTWPVVAGSREAGDLMLSAPIILYDYPAVAPESRDCFFDGTEIDEMLALRVLTLTEEEKSEAAVTDARAAAIVGRTGGVADATLHGAIRSIEELVCPDGREPGQDAVEVDSVRVSSGSRVRLVPRKGADAMDMFLSGRVATVAAVHRDLENRAYLAVTIDGDPGADLRQAYGRFFYFFADEVRPLERERDGDACR